MNLVSRVYHIAIICSDYEKSRRFYHELLGFPIIAETFRESRQSFKLDLQVGNGPVQIELFSFGEKRPPRPSYPEALGLRHLAFACSDLQVTVAKLTELGIECEPIRVDEITGKRFTFFADPDDLPLEIYEEIEEQNDPIKVLG